MENYKNYLWCMVLTMLIFGSCSKDDENMKEELTDPVATLSFATVLNDFMENKAALKQAVEDLPECSDAAPSYVEVVLTGPENVGTMAAPVVVQVNSTPGDYDEDGEDEYFTEYSSDLELTPGTYSLEYFVVYDADGNEIWVAPIEGSTLAGFVGDALPIDIELGAGVKKYVDVEVLCFDDREVIEYGYLFFDIEDIELFEFCFFANYCDENGRHFPAAISVDVWLGTDNTGTPLHTDLMNTIETDGEPSASPICFALPNLSEFEDDEAYIYYEVTVMDWEGVYGDVPQDAISGTLSRNDIIGNFDGDENVDYEHLFFGCGDDGGNGGDTDGDGIPDEEDDCPNIPGTIEYDGCAEPPVQIPGEDVVVFNDVNIFNNKALLDPDNVKLVQNLVTFTNDGPRNAGTIVLMDSGRSANCGVFCGAGDNWSTIRSTIEGEGFTIDQINSTQGSLTNIPTDVKIIFILLPRVNYTVEEINTLKEFASEGGRIVFVGEWDGYYGTGIAVENQFLMNMGAVLTNTGGAVDCALSISGPYIVLPSSSNRSHQIMEGIVDLTVACASVIVPGPSDFPLFYDTTNTKVLAGVAEIDTDPISELETVMMTKGQVSKSESVLNPSSTSGF